MRIRAAHLVENAMPDRGKRFLRRLRETGKESTWFRCQRVNRWGRVRTALYNDIKLSRLWSPNAKMGLVFTDHFCADRVAALYLVNLLFSARHGSPTCER